MTPEHVQRAANGAQHPTDRIDALSAHLTKAARPRARRRPLREANCISLPSEYNLERTLS